MARGYNSKCYCTNLRRSAGIITEYYDEQMKAAGLSVTQYYLLINLSRMEQANITKWAERTGLERSTMVRNLKKLHEKKWITEAKGHGKQYTLSEEGKKLLEKAIPIWEKVQKDLEEILGKEDAEAILRIGTKLQQL